MSKSKAVLTDGKKVLKNILIAVTTTVIGSSVIYFLGLNNKARLTDLEKEEITAETWKSFASIENILLKNTGSLLQDALQYRRYNDIIRQTAEADTSYEQSVKALIERDGVDEDLVALMKKRLATEKVGLATSTHFYNGLQQLEKKATQAAWPEAVQKDSALARARNYLAEIENNFASLTGPVEELGIGFEKKYTQEFDADDFVMIRSTRRGLPVFDLSTEQAAIIPSTPASDNNGGKDIGNEGRTDTLSREYIAGNWNQDGNTISFFRNGKITWFEEKTGKAVSGTWQITNNKLVLQIKNGLVKQKDGEGTFIITNVRTNSFTMQLTELTKDYYHLERM